MASPFTIFRKHQKVLIAVLGLMAMIAFVFLSGPVMDAITQSGPVNPAVVSTKKYGDLTEADLEQLVRQRNMVLNFFEHVYRTMGLTIPIEPPSEEAVVESWVLANRANDLGLVVSNEAINAYIKNMTADRISTDKIRGVLKELGISERQLFDALRSELAARQMVEMFDFSVAPTTPAQRWDYYQRLNRRATVEVAAVPVAKYLDQVEDPDESTLREFFDQYKESEYKPDSPDPGFRRPHRVAIEYFKAEMKDFLDPKSVTEEEIKDYYEQNKDTHYLRSKLPEIEKRPDTAKEKPAPGEKEKPATKVDEKPVVKPDEKPAPKAEEKPAPKAEEKPAPKAEEKPASDKPAGEEKKSAAVGRVSPFRVASYLEGEPAEKPVAKAEEPPKPSEKPAPKAEEPPKPAESKPGDAPKPPAKPGDEPKPPAKPDAPPAEKPGTQKPSTEKPSAEKPGAERPSEKAPESKYVPLEEVKDEIRDVLARGKARGDMEGVLAKLRDRMNAYSQARLGAIGQGTAPPEPLPMEELAKERKLTFGRTGLISEIDARQWDIGQSMMAGRDTFLHYAFQGRPSFQPATSQDMDGNSYLFWKVDEAKEAVPTWDDTESEKLEKDAEKAAGQGKEQEAEDLRQRAKRARAENESLRKQVLRTWKMVQARSLARDEASRLAAKARKVEKPLKETLAGEPGIKVIDAGPFSWLTHGAVSPRMFMQRPPPRISAVSGVDMPGNDFMESVFTMEPNDVGVAFNQPKTAAYVVRVASYDPSPAVLWQLFLAVPYDEYSDVAVFDQAKARNAWIEEIKTSIGFKWQRKPHQARER